MPVHRCIKKQQTKTDTRIDFKKEEDEEISTMFRCGTSAIKDQQSHS